MLFNSPEFLLAFLPVTFAGFMLLRRHGAMAVSAWLFVASLSFYAWWDHRFLWLLLGSIAFNLGAGRMIDLCRRSGRFQMATWMLGLALGCNVAAIAYFKYADFLLGSLGTTLGAPVPILNVVLPIGISFFTFTQIAFLVDVHRGALSSFNLISYGLFVTYFPHLIAGPILHHGEMIPQFESTTKRPYQLVDFAVGLTLLALGLAKKTLVADTLADYVGPVFDYAESGSPLNFIEAWASTTAYTLQIYFDFSAYSDMAVGISLMFGIRLPLNFNSPYKSRSIIEFWRRWHMSLSRFLRDYVYFAFGGNRRGTVRRHANLMATMLIGGLWHGASWNFVIWGGIHGFYLMVNHGWHTLGPRLALPCPLVVKRGLSWALTLLAVMVAWVFFRANTLDGALAVLSGMAGVNGVAVPNRWLTSLGGVGSLLLRLGVSGTPGDGIHGFLGISEALALGCGLALAVLAPNAIEIMRQYRPALGMEELPPDQLPPARLDLCWSAVIGVALAMGALAIDRESQFLYFRF